MNNLPNIVVINRKAPPEAVSVGTGPSALRKCLILASRNLGLPESRKCIYEKVTIRRYTIYK